MWPLTDTRQDLAGPNKALWPVKAHLGGGVMGWGVGRGLGNRGNGVAVEKCIRSTVVYTVQQYRV